jgi:RecB family exonuclease
MIDLIYRVYNYDTYQKSDKPNSISASSLLSPMFKIKKMLKGAERDESLVDNKYKRSSALGTAFHDRSERAVAGDPNFITEKFLEREIEIDGTIYTISGKFDGIRYNGDGTWDIYDFKTAYGKERKPEALAKDAMQMSIYRWLINGRWNVSDRGWSLFVSQSNNEQEAYPVELKSEEYIQNWIEEVIWSALRSNRVDCKDGVKYNPCNYCSLICEERK